MRTLSNSRRGGRKGEPRIVNEQFWVRERRPLFFLAARPRRTRPPSKGPPDAVQNRAVRRRGYGTREMRYRKEKRNRKARRGYLLVADKAAKGHAAPAHAAHQTAGKRLSSIKVDIVAVLVVDGDGLGAGAHKGVLPRAAKGGAGRHDVEVVALAEVAVGVVIEARGGQAQVVVRGLPGLVGGVGVGVGREGAAAKGTRDGDGLRLGNVAKRGLEMRRLAKGVAVAAGVGKEVKGKRRCRWRGRLRRWRR